MRIERNSAYYDVKYTERAKIISKILHIIKWPYKTLMAGRELLKTTDLLQTAYLEIVESRNNLEKKVEERTAELKQAQTARDRFFANISHEFRTPLTLILGPSEEIISEYPDKKLKFKAGLIKKNANRLLKLVNQLLDLSKIESGSMVLKVRKTNLIPYLKGIFFSFESLAKQKQITLQFYSGVENIDIYFDSQKMEQVFNNLISNAIKFTPKEGKVMVNVNLSTFSNLSKKENGEGSVEIKVKDTGVGIPNDQLDYVFNRFYQVNSSYEGVPDGTGIGLAFTKELVELHYGKITIKSEENKGTEFIVTLPLGKSPFKEDEIDSELITPLQFISGLDRDLPDEMEKEEILEQGNTFESEIILIVEDNKEVRKFIKKQLEPNYKIIEAIDGEDGFGKAADSIPDLIISDLMMPVMDGNEFCKKIRNDERTSHIPVIILTAKGGEESKLEGLETGADDYLIKPFSSRELMIRVRNLIEQRKKLREKFSRESFFKSGKISASSIDVRFITRIREAIEKNISNEKFSVENLASEIALSRVQLHRKLKALTNHSASDFILKMRLDRAADLLKKNAASISEIAYMTGFNTPNYFAKRFKKQFDCSPSEYKKLKFVDPE
jgi:signal transduction histidine kinase/DNA-binding response OmpR family regulator